MLDLIKCSGLMVLPQVAAAKGLVAGSFSVKRKDNSMVEYSIEHKVGIICRKASVTG
jgi:hypothetical protein